MPPMLRHQLLRRTVLGALVATSLAPSIAAAAGEPGNPTVVGTSVLGVVAEPSGSVVAVGSAGPQMLAQRVTASGATPAFAIGAGVARAAARQPDGRIVVAGNDGSGMVVRRLNPDGSLDATFGTVRPLGNQSSSVANAVAIAPNGAIVVGGGAPATDGFPRVVLVRLLPTGAPDTSFGNGGVSVLDLGRNSQALGVAVRANGSVVLAGRQVPDLQAINGLIAQVAPSGALDPGFNGTGVVFYFHPKGGASSQFGGVTIDAAGRVVAAGSDRQDDGWHALFTRLNPDGQLDTGFGTDGFLTPPASKNYTGADPVGARSIAVAGAGTLVAAGAVQDSGQRSAALWGITPSGQLDPAVGRGGVVETLPSEDGGESRAVIVVPDGSVFAGGDVTDFASGTKGFVLRYTGFAPLVTPPGATPPGMMPPATTPPGMTPPARTPPGMMPPATTPPGMTPPARTPPGMTEPPAAAKLSELKLTARALKSKTKATLTFSLSQAASVKLTVQQQKKRKKYVTVKGSKTIRGKQGTNRLTFARKFANRTLKKGSYRLVLKVSGGNTKTLTFTVR